MPTIESEIGVLYYAEVRGKGSPFPPLVLIHGAGGSHLDWPADLRRLPGARVLAMDLPGHGKSSTAAALDLDLYIGAVTALLEAREIPRAVLVGHSMGGAIAQRLALAHGGRVAGLVLIGTGSRLPVDPALPQRIVDAPEETVNSLIRGAWGPDATDDMRDLARERMLAVGPDVLRADYEACQVFDVRGRLDAIQAPALIIGATDDRMVPLKFSQTLAEQIPQAALVVMERTGHMIPQERPAEIAQAISEWLAGQTW